MPFPLLFRDLIACALTGSGKSAAFCFPIISCIMKKLASPNPQRYPASSRVAFPLALVLSHTKDPSCQIYNEIRKFSHQIGVKAAVAYERIPLAQQLCELERGVDILVATPGRLVDMIERARVSLKSINYLALDEADQMLDMGFKPIQKIVEQMEMPCPGARQILLFSATFPAEIQQLASVFLSNYIFITVGRVGSSTDLIRQKVEFVEDMNKRSHLMDLLQAQRQNGTHGKVQWWFHA